MTLRARRLLAAQVVEAGLGLGVGRREAAQLANSELIAFCAFYSKVLERSVSISDLLGKRIFLIVPS